MEARKNKEKSGDGSKIGEDEGKTNDITTMLMMLKKKIKDLLSGSKSKFTKTYAK